MEKKTLNQVLEELDKRYKYIAEETVYVENCKDYICINWHSFMSKLYKLAYSKMYSEVFAQVHK